MLLIGFLRYRIATENLVMWYISISFVSEFLQLDLFFCILDMMNMDEWFAYAFIKALLEDLLEYVRSIDVVLGLFEVVTPVLKEHQGRVRSN